MSSTFKNLIYQHEFSEETKFELLNIVDSKDWVERLFDLLEKLDARTFDEEFCDDCEFKRKFV